MTKKLQVAAALLLLLWVPSLLAQSAGTGALTGTVTDPTGAVVPNVTVTLTSADTNQARTANTGADGAYKFGLLPPGTYRVRFAAPGFKTSEIGGVTINVTETPTLDRALEVGAAKRAGNRRSIGRNRANGDFYARHRGRFARGHCFAAQHA